MPSEKEVLVTLSVFPPALRAVDGADMVSRDVQHRQILKCAIAWLARVWRASWPKTPLLATYLNGGSGRKRPEQYIQLD